MSEASAFALSPIPRSKLGEVVAKQIVAEIRAKNLQPGTRIPSERELMEALGVGRSTIREAINGLGMLGVLDIRHGQGAFVANPDGDALHPLAIGRALARGVTRDLFEARELVEVHVARLAAERRTAADLQELEQVLSDHRVAISGGQLAVEPSVRFHVRVAEAAHSDVLASFVISMAEIMTERGPLLEATPGYQEWELAQHTMVFEPIRDANPRLAAERMRRHLSEVVPHHEQLGLG